MRSKINFLCKILLVIPFTIIPKVVTCENNPYYETNVSQNMEIAKSLWLELDDNISTMSFSMNIDPTSQKSWDEMDAYYKYDKIREQNLSFDFPFYGHPIHRVRVDWNGRIVTPDYQGQFQHTFHIYNSFISPYNVSLVPNNKHVTVRSFNTDSQLRVQWEITMMYEESAMSCKFQATLYNTGNIVFVYKNCDWPLRVNPRGLSDTYEDTYLKGPDILNNNYRSSWISIHFTPRPTCLNHKDCSSCLSHPSTSHMTCFWCPTANLCSTGKDWYHQVWVENNCDKKTIKKSQSCPVSSTTTTTRTKTTKIPTTTAKPKSTSTPTTKTPTPRTKPTTTPTPPPPPPTPPPTPTAITPKPTSTPRTPTIMTTILTTKTSTTTKTLKPTTERPPPPTQPILDTALVVIVCSAFFLLIGCIGTLVVLVRRMRRTVTLIETETTQPADVVADTTNVANTTVVETTAEAVHTTQTQQVITAEETNTQTVQGVQMTQWTKRVIITKEELTTPGTENFFMMPIVKIEKQKTTTNQLASDDVNMAEYDLIPDNKWEFPRQSLSLGETLGEGAFGRVVRAEANGIMTPGTVTTVAVKMLKEDHLDSEMIALVSEMELMKMMGRHVNILNLLGACSQRGPLYVIVEFAKHNDLKHFLRKHRPLPEYSNVVLSDSNQVNLSEEVLVSFAHQVANGMKYLHSRKCLHRDLAARNVLVCQNFILKIADFGLARDVQAKEYYWMDSQPVLPYKWMAPESLSHHLFKYESDVWSYGVLLWEIMTFGEAPYPSICDSETMLSFLKNGHRLEKPSYCSDEIYDMMQECWKHVASDRPQFSQLVSMLDNIT